VFSIECVLREDDLRVYARVAHRKHTCTHAQHTETHMHARTTHMHARTRTRARARTHHMPAISPVLLVQFFDEVTNRIQKRTVLVKVRVRDCQYTPIYMYIRAQFQ